MQILVRHFLDKKAWIPEKYISQQYNFGSQKNKTTVPCNKISVKWQNGRWKITSKHFDEAFHPCGKHISYQLYQHSFHSNIHHMIRKILPGIAEVTTATSGGSKLFSRRCIFLHKEREALAYLGYFVAKLCILWCTFTGPNNAVVYQNWQISGTRSLGGPPGPNF